MPSRLLQQLPCKNVFIALTATTLSSFTSACTSNSIDDARKSKSFSEKLPSLKEAQRMSVYKRKLAFSKSEIDHIVDFEKKYKPLLGMLRRDAKGIKRLDGNWSTSYLHTDGLFGKIHPELLAKIVRLASEADSAENWGLLGGDIEDGGDNGITVRVVELHSVDESGGLPNKYHHDFGSVVTVDVMCSSPGQDFKGGEFCTLEADGRLQSHTFELGDVLIFPSHKYHCVQHVTKGNRRVLVVELWKGTERTCAHRCSAHEGPCNYSLANNRIEMLTTSAFPDLDPW